MMTNAEIKDAAFALSCHPQRCGEQYYLYCRGFLETKYENFHNLRRARMDAYLFDHYTLEFSDYDLIIGRNSLSYNPTPEMLAEIAHAQDVMSHAGEYPSGAKPSNTGHRVIDFELLLREGVEGVLARVREARSKVNFCEPDSFARDVFYQSMEISLAGLIRFGARAQAALAAAAEKEENAERRAQLQVLADMFTRIPAKPAQTFYEAIQSMWFVQFALYLVDDVTLTGHPDQYLYPYYKADLAAGRITPEFAMQLIEQLYFKHNEIYGSWPASLMVGGEDRDGNPVWNELTYMCIKAIRTTGLINPSVSVCYTDKMPDDLLALCMEIIAQGYTRPSLFNHEVISRGLRNAGVSERDARYYIHSTCVEITPIASSHIMVATPYVNLCKAFEYVLYEKQKPYTIGPLLNCGPGWGGCEPTPFLLHDVDFKLEELDTWEKFLALMKRVLSEIIGSHVAGVMRVTELRRRYTSSPLASAFIDDCIARGLDVSVGGARYNYCYPNVPGVINLIDSLAAIRQVVFEEGKATLSQIAEMCKNNFEGNEFLRQYIINRCPKFGNDDNAVDDLAVELYDFIDSEVTRFTSAIGGTAHPSYFAYVYHGWMGSMTDATPDGRLAGQALSEHLGAVGGMDRNGPTAVLHSIAKLDQSKGIGGIATNYRFAKNFISSTQGNAAVCSFVRSFMDNGCFEIQFNVIDKKELLDAREHPEQYRTLLVRVAGYSDYFVNLGDNIKDEIIARTENGGI
ncbi:MAG: hypothetical protein J6S76_00185 [Clostridia bacterium]|nr:hypothetical protein [Clostridia bacterium]